jgi:hypothetical protein
MQYPAVNLVCNLAVAQAFNRACNHLDSRLPVLLMDQVRSLVLSHRGFLLDNQLYYPLHCLVFNPVHNQVDSQVIILRFVPVGSLAVVHREDHLVSPLRFQAVNLVARLVFNLAHSQVGHHPVVPLPSQVNLHRSLLSCLRHSLLICLVYALVRNQVFSRAADRVHNLFQDPVLDHPLCQVFNRLLRHPNRLHSHPDSRACNPAVVRVCNQLYSRVKYLARSLATNRQQRLLVLQPVNQAVCQVDNRLDHRLVSRVVLQVPNLALGLPIIPVCNLVASRHDPHLHHLRRSPAPFRV